MVKLGRAGLVWLNVVKLGWVGVGTITLANIFAMAVTKKGLSIGFCKNGSTSYIIHKICSNVYTNII